MPDGRSVRRRIRGGSRRRGARRAPRNEGAGRSLQPSSSTRERAREENRFGSRRHGAPGRRGGRPSGSVVRSHARRRGPARTRTWTQTARARVVRVLKEGMSGTTDPPCVRMLRGGIPRPGSDSFRRMNPCLRPAGRARTLPWGTRPGRTGRVRWPPPWPPTERNSNSMRYVFFLEPFEKFAQGRSAQRAKPGRGMSNPSGDRPRKLCGACKSARYFVSEA